MIRPFEYIVRNKAITLSITSGLIILFVVVGGAVSLRKMYDDERVRVVRDADMAVDACVDHTLQLTNQVSILLNSVRMVYTATRSAAATERFVSALSYDRSVIKDIFLVGADGAFIIPRTQNTAGQIVTDRDYFLYHTSTAADSIFVSAVELGRLTGKYYFRMSRRITNPDGSFGGIVLVTLDPHMFTRYYQDLKLGPQNVAALIGIHDRRLRARIPEPEPHMWSIRVDAPLWTDTSSLRSGTYSFKSSIDSVYRTHVYRKVGDLPLVMVLGFLEQDVVNRTSERRMWVILLVSILIISIIVITIVWVRIIRANAQLTEDILERKRNEAERERLVAEMQATLDKVKQLEGILPICSFCKKIRDKQGEWVVMEKYIGSHSEAMFSHGFCPDCGREHYPEYFKDRTTE